MGYQKITQKGEIYIKGLLGTGTSHVSGKNKYVLPYCDPAISNDTIWTSNSEINGGITNNEELANKLIEWYNEYSKVYNIDANVMIAQAIIESNLKIWNYANKPSSASGISQFVTNTLFSVIIKNNGYNSEFTSNEISAITKNIITNETDSVRIANTLKMLSTYKVSYSLGKKNRAILHQNIIDNPKIMIKAQYSYMKKIIDGALPYFGRTNLASSALFGYNRGPDFIKDTYTGTIRDCIKRNNNNGYEKEGVDYVYKIFKLLYDKFGYVELNMDQTIEEFNDFDADSR